VHSNELIIQSSRLNALEKQFRTGQLNFEDRERIKSQIRQGVLDLLDEINKRNKRKIPKPIYNNILTILSIAIFGSGIFLINKYASVPKSNLLSTATNKDSKVSIKITNNHWESIDFSLTCLEGLQEITELYVEIDQLYQCELANEIPVSGFGSNNYRFVLSPQIKRYKLLPPTMTISEDSWVLQDKDIDLFSILFFLDPELSADLVIKAKVINHSTNKTYTVQSEVFKLEDRACGQRMKRPIRVENLDLEISPYVYKLLTNRDIWNNMEPKHKELNKNSFKEIASYFQLNEDEFRLELIKSNKEIINRNSDFPENIKHEFLRIGLRLLEKLHDLEASTNK